MVDPRVVSSLKVRRGRAGWSQARLAQHVGVSRQAIVAIEGGRQVPSTGLALRLAGALGCRVEDLFALDDGDLLDVELAPGGASRRVALGRVGGGWVAHRLCDATPHGADAVLAGRGGRGWRVEPLVDPMGLRDHVLIAGCAPLLGVLARHRARETGSVAATWLPANSRRALDLLAGGWVHVAGLHLTDVRSGDCVPVLRRHLPGRSMRVVHLTRWRQGLVIARGNPRAIREVADLVRPGLSFARRERGSGAEAVLRRAWAASGLESESLPGGPRASGHEEVARLVGAGAADAGVAIEPVALALGLGFVPLAEERFDLVVSEASADDPSLARILDLLATRRYRADVASLPGYDASSCGDLTTVDAA